MLLVVTRAHAADLVVDGTVKEHAVVTATGTSTWDEIRVVNGGRLQVAGERTVLSAHLLVVDETSSIQVRASTPLTLRAADVLLDGRVVTVGARGGTVTLQADRLWCTGEIIARGKPSENLPFGVGGPGGTVRLLADSEALCCHVDVEGGEATDTSAEGPSGRVTFAWSDWDGDGWSTSAGDCDPRDPTIHPQARETWYDGVDQDCAEPDDFDADGDGSRSAVRWLAFRPEPLVVGRGVDLALLDCDDRDPARGPTATETWYDGVDQNCDGWDDFDADADGIPAAAHGGTDCDDGSYQVHPGAREAWYDGIDQDCDGRDDFDADADGFPGGGKGSAPLDCDDRDPTTWPGAPETWYDGLDQDCDGRSDFDADGDGHAARDRRGDDCDDHDPAVYPGQPETWYDGVDQDCDGWDDLDLDGDTFPSARHGGSDCDDANPTVHPGAPETWYDGVDQDCDGNDLDRDGDGWPVERDCNDRDPETRPDARETWYDGIDQDCDGWDDWDADRDGFAAPDGFWTEPLRPGASDPNQPDCDDENPRAWPGTLAFGLGLPWIDCRLRS